LSGSDARGLRDAAAGFESRIFRDAPKGNVGPNPPLLEKPFVPAGAADRAGKSDSRGPSDFANGFVNPNRLDAHNTADLSGSDPRNPRDAAAGFESRILRDAPKGNVGPNPPLFENPFVPAGAPDRAGKADGRGPSDFTSGFVTPIGLDA
jgi:hypothetical protein